MAKAGQTEEIIHAKLCRIEPTLTADEKAEAAMELAKAYQELESLAIEKKKVIAEFENRKEKLRQQISLLSKKVKEGIEA